MAALFAVVSAHVAVVSAAANGVTRRQFSLSPFIGSTTLSPLALALAPSPSRGDGGGAGAAAVAAAPDGQWRFTPGADFASSPPLVRTHADEVTYKYAGPRASDWKYFKAGLTVDPVRLASLAAFDTPEGVGRRIVQAEMAKGGILESLEVRSLVAGG
ncbi:hypothetical protein KFE25_009492 [Diacronema lutheri]|uniref:Uncharacterized protein n=1 Tax=Diacronema lutheri TaxID=2081491 RepID=A0A8J5XKL6_DIALT|nr:hypothetical protein KFE25_009492 [Diacronema lutheri]